MADSRLTAGGPHRSVVAANVTPPLGCANWSVHTPAGAARSFVAEQTVIGGQRPGVEGTHRQEVLARARLRHSVEGNRAEPLPSGRPVFTAARPRGGVGGLERPTAQNDRDMPKNTLRPGASTHFRRR